MRSRDQDHPANTVTSLSLLNVQNLAGRGGVCIVPATWETETGELLEFGRQIKRAEIKPLYSSLATEQDSVSKQ